MKDLTGQRSGRLVALKPTEERKLGYVVWECQCDCGNTAYVLSKDIISKRAKSCGCLSKEGHPLDLAGQRFGRLTAIRPTEERKHTSVIWLCRCDCGNEVQVSCTDLRTGSVTTCDDVKAHGVQVRGPSKKRYMAGQRFGRLVLIRPSDVKQGSLTLWECACDCGNTTLARIDVLKKGWKKSCGCLKKEKLQTALRNNEAELCGKNFGYLTVIRATDTMLYGARAWECQCVCGNKVLVTKKALKDGQRRSCGCKQRQKRKKSEPEQSGAELK